MEDILAHVDIANADLNSKIKRQQILFGGNRKLKIYGKLSCKSGKRMKRENRVFFSTEKEAIINKYRPCGNCMRVEYNQWKNGIV